MSKGIRNPFYFAGVPLVAMGAVFAAIGASGQGAFGYTAVGLFIPGLVLVVAGWQSRRRKTSGL
ncbi:hypothetical protein [Pseudomonas sp. NPDC089734]|uniref:hypothetical protein n=1 Tax=Pseudomonas sp. NPDC089734 TaxID=3364469 RepID=UPI0037FD8AE3